MKTRKFAMASLAAAALMAPRIQAATYWVGSVQDPDWLKAENWRHNISDSEWENKVPVNDNMYFTDDSRNLATISQNFTGKGSLHVHSGLDNKPLVIQNNGKTWRIFGKIRIDDERSWRRGVVVFRGGSFLASSMVVGSVITNSCRATLENTAIRLSGETTLNQGRLTLGSGATLETTSVSYGTSTNAAVLAFNGGRLRYSPASDAEVFVPASTNYSVVVGQAGGTIDTAGDCLAVGASITNAPGEAGKMTFAGGGKVLLTGAIGWTGGTTVEAGTCLSVTNAAMKDAILENGLTLAVPDAMLEDLPAAPGDVSLLRIDSPYGRFSPSDLDKISMAGGASAANALRLSADRKEILILRPVLYSGTMSGSGVSNLGSLSWNKSIPSRFSSSDIVLVKCTNGSELNLDKAMEVAGIVFDIAPGVTLYLNRADNLKAARLRVTGGGTLHFNCDPGGIGCASVEVGSCIEVRSGTANGMLLERGLTVLNPKALVGKNGTVPLVRNVDDGDFGEGDLAKVAFPCGLRAPARLAADCKSINLVVTRHTASLNGGTHEFSSLSWTPALTSSPDGGDVLVVNVSNDTVLDIDAPIHPFAVKFAVSPGKRLTLTGCDVSAPFVWQEGGSVVVANVQSSLGTKVARFGRLLGDGVFAAGSGISRCDIEDVSGFAGTLDSGTGSTSEWRAIMKGGVSLSPASGGEVRVSVGGAATLAAAGNPLATGEGATLKGTLRICDGAELFARESGIASGGRYILDKGARLRARFTNPSTEPTVQNPAN